MVFYGVIFQIPIPIDQLLNYTKKEFVWNATATSAKAQIKLYKDDNTFETKDCDVIEKERIEPTCTTPGKVTYIAYYGKKLYNKYIYSDTTSITIPSGHKYKAPTFTWTNYTKSVATFVCEKDGDTQNVDGVITSKIEIEPTTEAEGLKVYTATFNFNGDTYTDTKKETLAKLEKPEPNGGDDPTPTNEISQNSQYKVWGYNNNIYIETENIDSQIQIFDINGRLIKSLKSTNTHTEININKGGIFVVVINNNIFKVAM